MILLLIGMFTLKARKSDRWEAFVLLVFYIVYMIAVFACK
jgi:Ca2+/Na+ antiporter